MLLCVDALFAPEARLWEDVLDALDTLSPLVDDARPGLAFVDMHGIAGEPQAWIERARTLLQPFGAFRLGVGCNKIAARAVAFVADGGICPEGSERALLAPLPLSLLEIAPETIERLRLLGVRRLGDLANLPYGPFVRRFGPQAAGWHRLACGADTTPLRPRGHAIVIDAAIFGEGSIEDEAHVFFALRMLLARIASDLCVIGRRAGAVQLDVELDDAKTCSFEVPFALPTAHEGTMFDVVRAKLEGVRFEAPVVGLRLRALRLEEGGEAVALFGRDDPDPQRVAVMLARLQAAGTSPQRAVLRRSYTLEERFAYVRYELPGIGRSKAPGSNAGRAVSMLRFCSTAAKREMSDAARLIPQLRLLQVAEIDVKLRRGEPLTVNGKAVQRHVGPWRIDDRNGLERDEYDVWLDDGKLYRIYRQGRRWYVRGAYD
jgi:hypothetical protein